MMIKQRPNLAAHKAAEWLVESILGAGSPWLLCESTTAAADLDPARPVTMPGHAVDYVEHARGHARAEYALDREGRWVVRADAAYVEAQMGRDRTLEVTTKRGPTKLIKIASVGVPFQTIGGKRLVYVHPASEPTPIHGRRRRGTQTTPVVRDLTGTTPCDHCAGPVRARFDAVDRDGVAGLVCVRCDALDAADRSYGTGIADAA